MQLVRWTIADKDVKYALSRLVNRGWNPYMVGSCNLALWRRRCYDLTKANTRNKPHSVVENREAIAKVRQGHLGFTKKMICVII